MDLVSAAKDALRVATSEGLAAVARADGALRSLPGAARSWAGLASPDDLRRLAAQIAALSRAADSLRASRS